MRGRLRVGCVALYPLALAILNFIISFSVNLSLLRRPSYTSCGRDRENQELAREYAEVARTRIELLESMNATYNEKLATPTILLTQKSSYPAHDTSVNHSEGKDVEWAKIGLMQKKQVPSRGGLWLALLRMRKLRYRNKQEVILQVTSILILIILILLMAREEPAIRYKEINTNNYHSSYPLYLPTLEIRMSTLPYTCKPYLISHKGSGTLTRPLSAGSLRSTSVLTRPGVTDTVTHIHGFEESKTSAP